MYRGSSSASKSSRYTVTHPAKEGTMKVDSFEGKTLPKPRAIQGFTIDRETLEHLSPLHRAAAECAIQTGAWHLV
jgi:hypothetical protein